ncbi:outer membrane protein OmpA-like peptidoglycan-associated protein [Saonia flava]|uniref:Outer membrane protein OmpA-like peptidoglycan-associated protein n=1 Tax=Saonia flava TaxID=523696 RepID=A0A846QZU1_9FLAO|nr:OmpA family protein [Saonia flava]NJB70644.1 outer membrane protein OmpA-like peptidoglycan-associated protein [Saonia flava]
MTKKIFIVVVTLIFSSSIIAQERLLNKANDKYEEYSFRPAIDIYKKVLDKGYASSDLLKKLGNSYYFNANYKDASEIYKKLVAEYSESLEPEYYFRYSQSLRSLEQYEESDALMAKFVEITDNPENKIERDYMEEIEKNSGRYSIEPFEYNSIYSEFAPAFYKKGLIFSSDRDTGNLARYRHTWNSKDFLDLYQINTDGDSKGSVSKLSNDINSRLHESTSISSKDGNIIYFTRNNISKEGKYVKDEDGFIRLKIFRAIMENGEWAYIEDLPFNSDSYSIAHPSLSPDEKTLYFASDMPGTFGESDIFKVTINKDGTFGTPENLGDNINTTARETFPFVTSDEILYFSSDGHLGLGGLDVFATKILREKYHEPILNVGRPVNSKEDDFTFIINEESKEGYFASNREGGMGEDDIYKFVENTPLSFECNQQVTGTVRDKISNNVLIGATVMVIDENNEVISSTFTDSSGEYFLTLDCNKGNFVRASIEGYVPSEEYLNQSDGKNRIIDFYLERETVTAGFGDDLAKLLQLSTIYFDLNKFNIRLDAEIEIQKVIAAMDKYPSLKIKVNSHTDSRGKNSYNLWLSQKRAEATVDYMVSKGISADRLKGEGYGETKLINECADGVRCSSDMHQLNRRSEFIILE